MKDKINILLFVLPSFIVVFLLFFVLSIAPFFHNLSWAKIIVEADSLQNADHYYKMLASMVGSLVGFLGVLLGGFYYLDKNRIANESKQMELKRQTMQSFMLRLDTLDDAFHQLLYSKISTDNQLDLMRTQVGRLYDDCDALLQESVIIEGFSLEDAENILPVLQCVDKSPANSNMSLEEFVKIDLSDLKIEYKNFMGDAKRTCYRCIK